MRRTASLAAALLALAACTPPAADPPAPPADAPPVEAPQPEPAPDAKPVPGLAEARQAWKAKGPASYAYTLTMACMCIHRGSYAVEVRNGELADVRDATTKQPSPESRVSWVLTVDRLMEAMEMASRAGTPVRATFDPALGYPVETEIGLLADDSGTLYTIENLRPL